MPTHASANDEIKQQYPNGHFCYAYKAGVLTNGLGVIRAIEFYDKDFFRKHPLINPKTFLGDAAFDSIEIYKRQFLSRKSQDTECQNPSCRPFACRHNPADNGSRGGQAT